MSERRFDTVLFDLDGTLIDTNELIIRSFQHALAAERPDLTRAEIILLMGRALTEQLQIVSGRNDVSHLLQRYRAYNVEHHNELANIFPYVREVLQQLQAERIKMAVVTTKMRASTERSLRHFEVMSYFEQIVSIEDVRAPKPSPEPVQLALQLLGARAERALMVGDSQFDLLAAQASGVAAVGVAWSLKGEQHLRQFPPVTIIHDMRQLLSLVGIEPIPKQ